MDQRTGQLRPQCMDAAEYAAWQQMNGAVKVASVPSPCDDCLAAHALEMRQEDRCWSWDVARQQWRIGRPLGYEEDEPPTARDSRLHDARVAAAAERRVRVAEAKRLREQESMSVLEIAHVMHTSTTSVSRYINDQPAHPPRPSRLTNAELIRRREARDARVATAIRMFEAGKTTREIAGHLHVRRSTVYEYLNGAPARPSSRQRKSAA